ncbi:MAG: SRPBCC domain-containing protein [Chloroflexi bacterium]|nr:SRPBCC domain-containing protein [Chloroflexota bacterium]
MPNDRVELQAEIEAPRRRIFELLATQQGLARWIDDVQLEPRLDGPVRLRLRDAVGIGRVIALSPPQHISFSWDWEAEPLGQPSVVAFDAIDHGARTHVTLRHVGLRGAQQLDDHMALWSYWFERFKEAAGALRYP